MKFVSKSPLFEILKPLSETEMAALGIWAVYRVCKTERRCEQLIEALADDLSLFSDFRRLLRQIWASYILEIEEDFTSQLVESNRRFSRIGLFMGHAQTNADEDDHALVQSMLSFCEILLVFLRSDDVAVDLGWCLENTYNFRGYQESFQLVSFEKSNRYERVEQLRFIEHLKNSGVSNLSSDLDIATQ